MKSDLSKVEVGQIIFTIQYGLVEVIEIDNDPDFPIRVESGSWYSLNGLYCIEDKHPSAFLEYPFKEQPIEKDTLVWVRDHEEQMWKVGYYSHLENKRHRCFIESKKSTETKETNSWKIATTENPLI